MDTPDSVSPPPPPSDSAPGSEKLKEDKVRLPPPPLTHIDLRCCGLGPGGVAVLSEAIARSPHHIQYLDLSENKIGSDNKVELYWIGLCCIVLYCMCMCVYIMYALYVCMYVCMHSKYVCLYVCNVMCSVLYCCFSLIYPRLLICEH